MPPFYTITRPSLVGDKKQDRTDTSHPSKQQPPTQHISCITGASTSLENHPFPHARGVLSLLNNLILLVVPRSPYPQCTHHRSVTGVCERGTNENTNTATAPQVHTDNHAGCIVRNREHGWSYHAQGFSQHSHRVLRVWDQHHPLPAWDLPARAV